jgi:hypothetical protein
MFRVTCKLLFLVAATLVLWSVEKAQAQPSQACVNSCVSALQQCVYSECYAGGNTDECTPPYNNCMHNCGVPGF